MNRSLISYILGKVMQMIAALLLLPCIVAIYYQESSGYSFLFTAVLCVTLGTLLSLKKPKVMELYPKDGLVITALAWIIISLLGAIPFTLSGEIPNYIDALFETISGFTTTGATILDDVEALSHACLMWRSFTHWIGGMGVLVFLMSILSLAGGNNMYLMKAESPGPSVGKLMPKVKHSARMLYIIYIVLTILQILLLLLSGMPFFHAMTLSFGTAGTGGFGILNSSIASYTQLQQGIITVFMLLFGVNFSLYFLIYTRKFKECLKNEEVKWYFRIFFFAVILIVINSYSNFNSLLDAVHHVAFQVSSIMTTTGYATCDFAQWPMFSQMILLLLMFVGASAGSTGGGMKVSRIVILFKALKKEIDYLVHPRRVKPITSDGVTVDKSIIKSITTFFFCYMILIFGSTLLLTLNNLDLATNFSAVVSAVGNIGPGLSKVGPTFSFSLFSPFEKIVLMFDMLAGRLELFPMLILFFPSTWKK